MSHQNFPKLSKPPRLVFGVSRWCSFKAKVCVDSASTLCISVTKIFQLMTRWTYKLFFSVIRPLFVGTVFVSVCVHRNSHAEPSGAPIVCNGGDDSSPSSDMNVVENFSLLQQVSVKIINVQFCRLGPETMFTSRDCLFSRLPKLSLQDSFLKSLV
jgi:hypothetical protein